MVTCTGLIDPLNLECLLVHYLAGSWFIYGFLALAVILMLAAQMRMSVLLLGTMVMLFGIMFADQMPWLYALVIVIGFVLIGISIAKIRY